MDDDIFTHGDDEPVQQQRQSSKRKHRSSPSSSQAHTMIVQSSDEGTDGDEPDPEEGEEEDQNVPKKRKSHTLPQQLAWGLTQEQSNFIAYILRDRKSAYGKITRLEKQLECKHAEEKEERAETTGPTEAEIKQKEQCDKTIEICRVKPQEGGMFFKDLYGLEETINQLTRSVLIPLLHPEIYNNVLEAAPVGVLMFGPPGVGKTSLVKAMVNEFPQITVLAASASSLLSKWLGQPEQRITTLFETARRMSPSVIFVDEADGILCSRKSSGAQHTRTILLHFMAEMDGLKSKMGRTTVMLGTNSPYHLDEAVLDRASVTLYFQPPTMEVLPPYVMQNLNNANIPHSLTPEEVRLILMEWNGTKSYRGVINLMKRALSLAKMSLPLEELTKGTRATLTVDHLREASKNWMDIREDLGAEFERGICSIASTSRTASTVGPSASQISIDTNTEGADRPGKGMGMSDCQWCPKKNLTKNNLAYHLIHKHPAQVLNEADVLLFCTNQLGKTSLVMIKQLEELAAKAKK
jgi:SpoVK/Ycf46/Vps4 family AAA+-type ATPase